MSAAIGQISGLDRSNLASVFDPMIDEFDYCELHGLQLSTARSHGWVICATLVGLGTGPVLACVEESEDQFELIQIDEGFRWSIHDSLHDALRHMFRAMPLPVFNAPASNAGEAAQSLRTG